MSEARAYKFYFDPLKAEFLLLGIPAIEVQANVKSYYIPNSTSSFIAEYDNIMLFSPIEIDGELHIDGSYEEILSSETSVINEKIAVNSKLTIPSNYQIDLVTEFIGIDGSLTIDGELIQI